MDRSGSGVPRIALNFQEIRSVIFTAPAALALPLFRLLFLPFAFDVLFFRRLIPNSIAKYVHNSLVTLYHIIFHRHISSEKETTVARHARKSLVHSVPFVRRCNRQRSTGFSHHLERRAAAHFFPFHSELIHQFVWNTLYHMRAVTLNESKLLLFFLAHWMLKLTWMNLFT